MATVFETEVCSRCGGTGHYSFNGEHSRCYKCEGRNGCRSLTKRGAAAKMFYEASLTIPVSDVALGSILRDVSRGVKQLTVTAMETQTPIMRAWVGGVEQPRKPYLRVRNDKGAYLDLSLDGIVRRVPTAEENDMLIAAALAYQDTLTKAGTPRKR